MGKPSVKGPGSMTMNEQERMEAICHQIMIDGRQDIRALLSGRDVATTMLSLGLLDPGHADQTDRILATLNIRKAVNYKCRMGQDGHTPSCMFIGVADRSLVLRYVARAQRWTNRPVQAVDIPDGHIGVFVFDARHGIRYIDFAVCVLSVRALDEHEAEADDDDGLPP
jgi:hypothetical protein